MYDAQLYRGKAGDRGVAQEGTRFGASGTGCRRSGLFHPEEVDRIEADVAAGDRAAVAFAEAGT